MKKLFIKILIVFGFLVQSVFGDITTGLIAHYGFENNANDSSGNNYNGTTAGALTYSSGKVGQSAIFNGNSSIELPSDVNLSNQSFTISGWFKPNNVTDGMWIMSQGTVAGEYKYLQLNIYNKNFQVDFFNHSASSTGTATTPNQWYYYTVTFDNTTKIATIYLNGVQSGSANMGGSFTGTTPFRIGLYNSTHFYTGEMDEIKIYNRTLSSSDVTALYQATIPPDITSNLIAHYEFEGNANDSSGNSYNGTYSNFTSGKFGQSASFNGSQSLTINSIAGHLPSGNSARTVSMWVKPSQLNLGHAGNFVSWGNNTIGERYSILHYDTSGLLAVASHTGNGFDVEPDYTFTQDQWVHLTVVYNENNVTNFYINGSSIDPVTAFPHNTASNTPLVFGSNPDATGEQFNGQIDEVRIYNRALTSSDVTALYNYTPTPKLTLKVHGGVVQLDGSKDYLLLPAITEVATNNAFTIESLVNLASDGDRFHHIFRQNGDIEYALRFDTNDNQLAFYIRDTNENGGAVTYNLTEDLQEFKDSWHHIAATFDANNLKLYVDGVQKASMAHNLSSLPSISGDAFIGATNQNATDNERFNGLIDEVRIWNIARTQSQIQTNMNQQLDGNETGLVAYYNFDERVGDIVLDIAGKDQNGTIEGNVTRLNFLGDGLTFNAASQITTEQTLSSDGNISFSAWIKPTSVGSGSKVIFHQSGSYAIELYDGRFGASSVLPTNGVLLPINQWSHITATMQFLGAGSTLYTYYVNGVEVASFSAWQGGNTNNLMIGTIDSSFSGQIAEATAWNKLLTQAEIQKLMVSAPKPNDTNLVGYWPLNDGAGTTAIDYSATSYGKYRKCYLDKHGSDNLWRYSLYRLWDKFMAKSSCFKCNESDYQLQSSFLF